jgi:hypothetical protein
MRRSRASGKLQCASRHVKSMFIVYGMYTFDTGAQLGNNKRFWPDPREDF